LRGEIKEKTKRNKVDKVDKDKNRNKKLDVEKTKRG
jgi:hypothetical protein